MRTQRSVLLLTIVIAALICMDVMWTGGASAQERRRDPLPSWHHSDRKDAILTFVATVTREGDPQFVPESERIAVFDNDGTLWIEQPVYTQLHFTSDRLRSMAAEDPSLKSTQPFKAFLDGDMKTFATFGERGLMQVVGKTHAGMTTDEFARLVQQWFTEARHPRFDRPYTKLIYAPMWELLHFLRGEGFKTYIVSGGGVEFVRVVGEEVYGIPPEQTIGSSIVTSFEIRNGEPVIVRESEVFFVDNEAGKPVAIQKFIGRRPIAAFGNSDGDLQMIQWTTASDRLTLAMFVHHTDAEREYAYDRDSHVGRFDKALDLADSNGWHLIDMKDDWKRVFAYSSE